MKAILITGFSHWGKTTIIQKLFHPHRRFGSHVYRSKLLSASYAVQSASNDDIDLEYYLPAIREKINLARKNGIDLIAAFCPTKKSRPTRFRKNTKHRKPAGRNDSREILNLLADKGIEIHLIMLIYKWDIHAELRPKEIREYYSEVPGIHYHFVRSTEENDKLNDVVKEIKAI